MSVSKALPEEIYAELDEPVRDLCRVLNEELASVQGGEPDPSPLTIRSCGGHLEPLHKPAFPYVAMNSEALGRERLATLEGFLRQFSADGHAEWLLHEIAASPQRGDAAASVLVLRPRNENPERSADVLYSLQRSAHDLAAFLQRLLLSGSPREP